MYAAASSTSPKTLWSAWRKRKLARSIVAKQYQCFPLYTFTYQCETERNSNATSETNVAFNLKTSVRINSLNEDLLKTNINRNEIRKQPKSASGFVVSRGTTQYPRNGCVSSKSKMQSLQTVNVAALCLPKPTHKLHSLRQYSSRHGDNRHVQSEEKETEDDEEKKRKLRGAVMYVTNPVSWVINKWNLFRLKRMFDPSFSENEFVFGARQAICHVAQMVSLGRFYELNELVLDEVIEWLRTYRTSLSDQELGALSIDADDVILIKLRYIQLDTEEDKKDVYMDVICFGLKVSHNVPYLADMGIRFKRDYSSKPPSSWIVAGITHIRLQNLAPE